jgi:hypothetical protein
LLGGTLPLLVQTELEIFAQYFSDCDGTIEHDCVYVVSVTEVAKAAQLVVPVAA